MSVTSPASMAAAPGASSWAWVRAPDARGLPCLQERRFQTGDDGGRIHPATPADAGVVHRLVPLVGYRELPPRRRPPAWCPVCLEPVRMKLGRVMRPHYAHLPDGSSCGAGTPEGQAHLQAKYTLADALRGLAAGGAPALEILVRCAGSGEGARAAGARTGATDRRGAAGPDRCRATDRRAWLAGWDDVRVEQSLPSLRADLLLLRGGEPVGAIEVRVTSALDEGRAAKYAATGVPWIEVLADDVLGLRGPTWRRC